MTSHAEILAIAITALDSALDERDRARTVAVLLEQEAAMDADLAELEQADPRWVGSLSMADIGTSGTVTEPGIRGMTDRVTHLSVLACIHHDHQPITGDQVTYLVGLDTHVFATAAATWETTT